MKLTWAVDVSPIFALTTLVGSSIGAAQAMDATDDKPDDEQSKKFEGLVKQLEKMGHTNFAIISDIGGKKRLYSRPERHQEKEFKECNENKAREERDLVLMSLQAGPPTGLPMDSAPNLESAIELLRNDPVDQANEPQQDFGLSLAQFTSPVWDTSLDTRQITPPADIDRSDAAYENLAPEASRDPRLLQAVDELGACLHRLYGSSSLYVMREVTFRESDEVDVKKTLHNHLVEGQGNLSLLKLEFGTPVDFLPATHFAIWDDLRLHPCRLALGSLFAMALPDSVKDRLLCLSKESINSLCSALQVFVTSALNGDSTAIGFFAVKLFAQAVDVLDIGCLGQQAWVDLRLWLIELLQEALVFLQPHSFRLPSMNDGPITQLAQTYKRLQTEEKKRPQDPVAIRRLNTDVSCLNASVARDRYRCLASMSQLKRPALAETCRLRRKFHSLASLTLGETPDWNTFRKFVKFSNDTLRFLSQEPQIPKLLSAPVDEEFPELRHYNLEGFVRLLPEVTRRGVRRHLDDSASGIATLLENYTDKSIVAAQNLEEVSMNVHIATSAAYEAAEVQWKAYKQSRDLWTASVLNIRLTDEGIASSLTDEAWWAAHGLAWSESHKQLVADAKNLEDVKEKEFQRLRDSIQRISGLRRLQSDVTGPMVAAQETAQKAQRTRRAFFDEGAVPRDFLRQNVSNINLDVTDLCELGTAATVALLNVLLGEDPPAEDD